MKDAILKIILTMLPAILNLVTPEIRQMIEDFILRWWEKAKETDNDFDDFLVMLIAALLKIDLP